MIRQSLFHNLNGLEIRQPKPFSQNVATGIKAP